MNALKVNERDILMQESIRFSDEDERNRLNIVLQDVRAKTDGTIHKMHFIKALMGIKGYELRGIAERHRLFLAGKISNLGDSIEAVGEGDDGRTGEGRYPFSAQTEIMPDRTNMEFVKRPKRKAVKEKP